MYNTTFKHGSFNPPKQSRSSEAAPSWVQDRAKATHAEDLFHLCGAPGETETAMLARIDNLSIAAFVEQTADRNYDRFALTYERGMIAAARAAIGLPAV